MGGTSRTAPLKEEDEDKKASQTARSAALLCGSQSIKKVYFLCGLMERREEEQTERQGGSRGKPQRKRKTAIHQFTNSKRENWLN